MISAMIIKFRDRRSDRGSNRYHRTPISTRGHVSSSYIKILSSVAALTARRRTRLTKSKRKSRSSPLYLSGAHKARLFTSAISSSRKQRICIKPWTHYPRRHIQYTLLGGGEGRGIAEAGGGEAWRKRMSGATGAARWLRGGFQGGCRSPLPDPPLLVR